MSGADECDWEDVVPAFGWIMAKDQIAGIEKQWEAWARCNVKTPAYLEYNTVPDAPPPQELFYAPPSEKR